MDNEEFWDTIEDWKDPTTVNVEFCGNCFVELQIFCTFVDVDLSFFNLQNV